MYIIMKTFFFLISLIVGGGFLVSCKKEFIPYIFPNTYVVNKNNCVASWEELLFEASNYDDRIYLYQACAWYGTAETDIIENPSKFDFCSGGGGIRFVIDHNQLNQKGNVNYIFVRLKGYSNDRGYIGDSKLYKFKKITADNCLKWVAYE
jgi:hypothetical protein